MTSTDSSTILTAEWCPGACQVKIQPRLDPVKFFFFEKLITCPKLVLVSQNWLRVMRNKWTKGEKSKHCTWQLYGEIEMQFWC